MTAFSPPCLALAPDGILAWFDEAPFRYWTIAWVAWGAVLLLTVLRLGADWHPDAPLWRRLPRRLLDPLMFAMVAVLALVAFRWPGLVAGPMRNPDETQLGAGAMTYWRDPVPWRSVDMHTSGPINAYFLWPALLFDGRISYFGLRLAALFAHGAAALACYGLLRRFTSEGIARLGMLPLLGFVAFNSVWEYVQYSSEQPSFCLLAVAAWLLADACLVPNERAAARRRRLLLAGVCLGCLPFAKAQSVVLGVTLGGFGLVAAWSVPAATRKERIGRVLALTTGAILPGLIFLAWIALYGQGAQAYMAYIESNRVYVAGHVEDRMKLLRDFYALYVGIDFVFKPFFLGTVGLAVAVSLIGGVTRPQTRIPLWGAWVLVAVGLWTVIYPGRVFWHYLHFLVLPLAWLGGLSLAAGFSLAESRVPVRWATRIRWIIAAGVIILILVPQILTRVNDLSLVGALVEGQRNSVHPVSRRLRELAQPGDTLVVWGWAPRLHTESGLTQGARDAQAEPEIAPGPMNRFYRERMMWDLRKHPPAFFVDAIADDGFIYTVHSLFGPQIFPELADWVGSNYHLVENLDGYRIYARNTRTP